MPHAILFLLMRGRLPLKLPLSILGKKKQLFGQCGVMVRCQDGTANCMDLSRFDAAPLIAFIATKEMTMGTKRTDEFRKDAVRIALTSGLTRKQVADDLGVGMSTLDKWITTHRGTDVVSKEDLGLAQENDRLRRENRILKEEREILKKATVFFASQKP